MDHFDLAKVLQCVYLTRRGGVVIFTTAYNLWRLA